MAIRCPHCGSPVMIRGNRWECGWCGDSGRLKHSSGSKKIGITLSFSAVYHVDLPKTWENMKSALKALAPGRDAALLSLLGKVLLHEISAGIQHRGIPPESEKLRELEQFLKGTHDLNLDAPASSVVQTIQTNILYPQQAELSEQSCGEFWRELIAPLTREHYYRDEPEGLFDLLHELSSAYSYFGDTSGEELGTAQRRRFALNDAFYYHLLEKVLLHPDVARAKQLLAKGDFPDNEDICRDILVTEFPEEVSGYTLENLDDRSWDDILEDVFERDAPKGLRMWRTLLDIASPRLSSDSETAQQLLQDWSILDHPTSSTAEAFLTALEDDVFARQIFQSADVGDLQQALLTICRKSGRLDLEHRCLDIVLKNSYLDDAWERQWRKMLASDVKSPKAQSASRSTCIPPVEDHPDDGTVFHYCTVKLQGIRRPYSYLTGGLPLEVGDWVEVPFGKEDQPRCGQVGSVTDCTRSVAPWPPEQTKTVLRIVEAPSKSEGKRAPVTALDAHTPEPVQENPPPSLDEAAQKEVVTEVLHSNEVAVVSQKRKFPWKLTCAGLAVLIAIVGGSFAHHGWDLHYRQAEQYILDGKLPQASDELGQVPSFFRSQKQLVRYIHLCELAQSGTEEHYKAALDGLQIILDTSNDTLKPTMQAQYMAIQQQYHDQLYQTALARLQEKQFDQAQKYLSQVLEYPYATDLLNYAQASSMVPSSQTSAQLKSVMKLLEQIPEDYGGPFAEEILALRAEVTSLLSEATAREKAEETARKEAGLPYVGMSETEIHTTRQLGKAGYSGTSSDYKQDSTGKYYRDTWNVYAWYDTNGNMVFKAECRNGKVFQVNRYGDSAWDGDKLQVKLGPFRPHTFNSGITDDEYSGDTGPGSGSNLRDDYDSPEDLYEEDGTYSDLDEAIDEWEEGW